MRHAIGLVGLMVLAVPAVAATHDNNVEWSGVTHIHWLDRAPRCPINGESFTIKFQTWHYDITSARVYVNAGAPTWVNAGFVRQAGPYDVWTARIPASSPTGTLEYYIELTDGTDTDYLGPGGMSATPPATGWTLNFATNTHAPLGGTLTSDGGAVFRVWAPGATTANVAGQFNGWSSTSLPMTKSGSYFTRKVSPPVLNNQQYKYVFGGGTWKPDARGRAMNPGDNNNTYIVDPNYAWQDQGFSPPAFEDMVLYQLHVGTFSGFNDGLNRMGRFRDIVDTHLNHLLYLGVNVVQLMPITEFDYHESWGYNPVNNWAPENAYGSPTDLKYTIDRLHRAGIAVVLDVCFNHFSPSGNFMWYYDGTQIYFDIPAVETPWGSQAAFWKQEVRDYYADAIQNWLEEYRVDGFRMDATRYMRNNWMFPQGYPDGWALMQRINNEIDARKVQAISIAEELPNETAITRSTASGGAGFDSQWHDLFNDDVRQEVFDAASGDPEMWKIRNAINASDYPNKTHLVRYVESHDEAAYGRLAPSIDSGDPYSIWARGRSKLAQGLTILTPGIPMFLQGGEWLENIAFGSGWSNRIDWSKATGRAPMVLFFRDVIGARKSNCALRSNAGVNVFRTDDTGNVIGMQRWDLSGNEIVVVASLNNSDLYNYRIGFPRAGTWYEILNSQAGVYLGNGVGNGGSVTTTGGPYDGLPYSAWITIPQMGLLVFRYDDAPGRSTDLDGDGDTDLRDYAPLQQAAWWQGCGLAADISENGRVDDVDFQAMLGGFTGPQN